MMYQSVENKTNELSEKMKHQADSGVPFEAKDLMTRFIVDTLGSVGFGIDCRCLTDTEGNFVKFAKVLQHRLRTKHIQLYLFSSLPKLLQPVFGKLLKLLIKYKTKKFSTMTFFERVIFDVVEYRRKNDIVRDDLMHILLSCKNFTMNEILAQSLTFFIAGFDTTSTTLAFALYELARSPDVQIKLREEIQKSILENNWDITFDTIPQLSYLDMILNGKFFN